MMFLVLGSTGQNHLAVAGSLSSFSLCLMNDSDFNVSFKKYASSLALMILHLTTSQI
jgi:hypothetical protein